MVAKSAQKSGKNGPLDVNLCPIQRLYSKSFSDDGKKEHLKKRSWYSRITLLYYY